MVLLLSRADAGATARPSGARSSRARAAKAEQEVAKSKLGKSLILPEHHELKASRCIPVIRYLGSRSKVSYRYVLAGRNDLDPN